jgi:hypothetical protein
MATGGFVACSAKFDDSFDGDALTVQASRLYPISSGRNVHAHQLWAACALYQATKQARYWSMTTELYANMDADDGGRRLYWPLVNYDNPVWYGIMCMAQSGRTYNGLEVDLDINVKNTGNKTLEELIVSKKPSEGSRLDATNQLWAHLVSAWLEYGERAPVQCALVISCIASPELLTFLLVEVLI